MKKPLVITLGASFLIHFYNLALSSFINKRKVKFMRESERNSKASKRFFEKAINYFINENYDDSMIFVNKAIQKDPRIPDYYVLRGDNYIAKNNPPKALENYSNAMIHGLRDESVYYSRGYAYQQLGNTHLALVDYNLALELNPKYSPALSQRGIIFMELKNYANAIKDFDAALEIDQNDNDTWFNKFNAYEQKGDLPMALDELNAFVSARKNDVPLEFFLQRGHLNSKMGFGQKSVEDFSRLIFKIDDFELAYEWRATEYEKLGELEKAKADRDKVNELKSLGV